MLCCFFASCGVTKKLSNERLISKTVVSHYAVDEQSDLPIKSHLEKVDTFYYNSDKISYREVELTFGIENPNRITSYMLYLVEFDNDGKMAKVDAYYIPQKPDGSLVNPNHIKKGTGQSVERWLYTYNDIGDKIESQYYSRNDREDHKMRRKTIYSYDKKKNLSEEMSYFIYGQKKHLNQYNKKGNKISETQYTISDSITQFDTKTLYKYNKQGDVETEEVVKDLGVVSSKRKYEYIYDMDKHWTTKIEYLNGKPYKISEREFEYYESSYIQNELWWLNIPAIHSSDGRGLSGAWALYLYDDGRFIEKNVEVRTAKKHTRKGYYTYCPETVTVQLTYTDKEGDTITFTHPSFANDIRYLEQHGTFLGTWSVRKLENGEKAKYIE